MAKRKEPKREHLYDQVVNRVTTLIRKGSLKSGEKIPSVRGMSEQMSVAISTVLHAYQILEDQGLIEPRPQSGYFVKPMHVRRVTAAVAPPEPEMRTLALRASRPRTEDIVIQALETTSRPGAVALGTAIQSPEYLPTDALSRHLARVVREDPETACQYAIGAGLGQLRQRITKRALDSGCSLGPDDIVITNGASEALALALRAVTEPGDTVAVESPCYFGFLTLLKMLHLNVVELSTDPRDGLSIEHLEKLIDQKKVRCKALIVNPNVHNPLGSIMPDEKKRRIVELTQKDKIAVIEDDTYGDLAFESPRPRCMKSFDKSGNVMLCSSFSKTLAPGFRIGWIAGGRWHDRIMELKCTLSLGSATPLQFAIASYLETGGFDRHLRRLRKTYQDQVRLLSDAVRRHFPDGTRATNPKGGHLLWVELPQTVDCDLLHHQLAKKNITISPGTMFSAGQHYGNCIRLNAAVTWNRQVENAVARIGKLAR